MIRTPGLAHRAIMAAATHAPRPFPAVVLCARPGAWCGEGTVAHTHQQFAEAVADRQVHRAHCPGPPKPHEQQLWSAMGWPPLPPPPRPFTLLPDD